MKKEDILTDKIFLLYGFINDPGRPKGFSVSLPSFSRDGVTVYFSGFYVVPDETDFIEAPTKDGEIGFIAVEKALMTVEDLGTYYERKTGRSLALYIPN